MIGQLHADKLLDSAFMICKIINASVRVITSKNPCRVSHAMRPGFKDAVKCILRIGSAHSKGGEL